MAPIKVIYIISKIDKAFAFEWISDRLDRARFDLTFILLNPGPSYLEDFLQTRNRKVYRLTYHGKKDAPRTFYQICKIVKTEKPAIIHTHLFDACLLGLAAGKLLGVRKRIHTRHHGSQHHVYFPKAVYYDRIINFLSTDIVAPSQNVRRILVEREKVDPAKVKVIHHGFSLGDFVRVEPDRVARLQAKYNPEKSWPVIGVISRYTHLKGIQFVIPAFNALLRDYPDAYLVLANATGDYHGEIKKQLQSLPERNYTEVLFEEDLFAFYRLFDVFVNVTIDAHSEAFGQTYIEALAAGIPSVFTLSGVAGEFITDRENALVVPFQNPEAIYSAMVELLRNRELASDLRQKGRRDVFAQFGIDKMITQLETTYQS